MVHNQLLLFDNFLVLYIQHNRRRFPTNHYIVLNHHQFFMDTTAVVHNQLHDLVRLYFQYNW